MARERRGGGEVSETVGEEGKRSGRRGVRRREREGQQEEGGTPPGSAASGQPHPCLIHNSRALFDAPNTAA